MPLWSLTQERVDRLLRQIGDKELEIDTLIKLTKEDLWTRDLDDFINEWRFQLEDEDKRQRKVANLGRRTSKKLMIGDRAPAVKKRKGLGDDPDDDDFGMPKAKKQTTIKTVNVVKPKPGLLDYLQKTSPKSKPVVNGLKPATAIRLDGADDSLGEDDFDMPVTKKVQQPKRKVVKDEEDDFSEDTVPSKPAPRNARAAAQKRVVYGVSSASEDESDNGDDLLGDVSRMVKGIGGTGAESSTESRALFSTSLSRPGSSAGIKTAPRPSKAAIDLSADETDYTKLVPHQSPRKSILVTAKDTKLSDDEDEDDDILQVIKPKAKPQPKAKAPSVAPKPAKPAANGGGRGKPKKTEALAAAVSAPVKAVQLSPAAKAYAAKQAKAVKKQAADSDDDIDAMANDILNSASDQDDASPARKPAARPARRAATAKKQPAYVIDDESEDVASEEDEPSALYSESE